MTLASEVDVESALGRDLAETEDVSTLLEEASDLVAGYLGYTPDPVPSPAPARAEDDRAAAMHPFVQQLADLFDARIVRIEAAGTLPASSVPPADPAESADGADLPDPASDLDPADPGDR